MNAPNEPSGPSLLALEQAVRRHGSQRTARELLGEWWLQRLWSREGRDQGASAAMLRGIGACLAISACGSSEAAPALQLRNRVTLGAMALEFSGPGWLSGRRPLLRFRFERMALLWGGREIWHTQLPAPAANKLPFFALIGCERSNDQGWLAARGRGGGLALWRLRPSGVRG
jgi:hypothetical protein